MIPAYVIIAMGREGWYTREAVALTRALFFPPFVFPNPGPVSRTVPPVTQRAHARFSILSSNAALI